MYSLLLKIWKRLPFSTNIKVWIMGLINDQFLIGVTGIFFDKDNKILLVKHSYRGSNNWSLPGGYIKKGEHPKEGLEREVDEETGYVVSADTRLKIRTDRNNARLDITYAGVFIGGNYKPSKEITEAKFFRFEKLPILPQDQLVFIDEALRLRKLKTYLFNDSITTGV
ncbi:MAG: NUDIX hydrolase [Microgenomates group bacterium]